VPELVPQDGDADELLTDEDSLLDESRAVIPHFVHDRQGGAPPSFARVLGGLEEASRLFYGDHNIDAMFATLEPLHDMLEKVRTRQDSRASARSRPKVCAKEISRRVSGP
jgi:hypothetical protein